MPHSFDVDWKHRILRGRFRGRVTDEELRPFYWTAYQHVFRLQSKAGVVDFSEVTAFEVSAKMLRELVNSAPILADPNLHRVIIAPSPEVYRMARKFQKWSKDTRPNLHVVRIELEAWAILAVEDPRFSPLELE